MLLKVKYLFQAAMSMSTCCEVLSKKYLL